MGDSVIDAPATGSSNFHLFPSLPAELRINIWCLCLPETDPPALTPYRPRCWRRVFRPQDEDTNDNFHSTLEEMTFRPDLLDKVRVKLPLNAVNHEARAIAIEWVHKQGVEIHLDQGKQCNVYLRPFDAKRDVLWISPSDIETFNIENWSPNGELDTVWSISAPIEVRQFAVSESLLKGPTYDLLYDTIECFFHDTILHVVANEEPVFGLGGQDNMGLRPRWELYGAQGESLVWNRNSEKFDMLEGKKIIDCTAHGTALEASKALRQALQNINDRKIRFEVRAVLAVKIL